MGNPTSKRGPGITTSQSVITHITGPTSWPTQFGARGMKPSKELADFVKQSRAAPTLITKSAGGKPIK